MSRVATTKNQQASVDKYLLPAEVRVATVRRHPAVLILSSLQAVGGLLAAAVLTVTVLRTQAVLASIVWIGWGVLMVRLLWKAGNWFVDYFVVTSVRLMLTSGVFTRKVSMMPLDKVVDMRFERSFGGRLLGYGEFIVESAAKDQALSHIDHVPYPEQLYLLICGRIFKSSAAEEVADPPEPDDNFDDFADPYPVGGGGIEAPDDL